MVNAKINGNEIVGYFRPLMQGLPWQMRLLSPFFAIGEIAF